MREGRALDGKVFQIPISLSQRRRISSFCYDDTGKMIKLTGEREREVCVPGKKTNIGKK